MNGVLTLALIGAVVVGAIVFIGIVWCTYVLTLFTERGLTHCSNYFWRKGGGASGGAMEKPDEPYFTICRKIGTIRRYVSRFRGCIERL